MFNYLKLPLVTTNYLNNECILPTLRMAIPRVKPRDLRPPLDLTWPFLCCFSLLFIHSLLHYIFIEHLYNMPGIGYMKLTIQWVKINKQKLFGILEGDKWDTEK